MTAPLVCAVDVGSTRIKAALRTPARTLVGPVITPYPPGGSHEAIWAAVAAAIHALSEKGRPDALILCAHMGGLCLLDKSQRPIGVLESGIDLRPNAALELDPVRSGCERDRGTAAHRLLSLLTREPRLRLEVGLVGGVKEYLLAQLVGSWVTDPSSASASGFYDLVARDWSEQTCAVSGIDPRILPEIADPGTVVGSLTATAAATCGLPAGAPVLCGTGDGPAASLSAAAFDWRTACLSQGTTTVARVLGPGDRPPAVGPDCFTQHVATGWWASGARTGAIATPSRTQKVLARLERHLRFENVLVTGGNLNHLDDPRAVAVPRNRADGTHGLTLIAAGAALPASQPFQMTEGRR